MSTSTAAWGSGATSAQLLPATTDGWTEATVEQVLPTFMVGLGDQYGSAYFSYIDYAWYVYGNSLRVYESGTSKWTAGSVYPGDVLRVERVNATIYYKRNGVVQYTSTVPSTTSLMTYVSFNGMGAKFSNGRLSSTFPSTALTATSSFTKRFDYDHAGRLLKTWHQTDTQPEVLLSMNVYNELGQLIDKKLYNTDAPETADNQRTFKQSVDYRYNIRGWLTSINNSTLTSDGVTNDDTGDFFGMNLNYEKSDPILGSTSLFNGNISGMKWSSGLGLGDTKEQGYTFAYDPLNRLTDANSRMNKTNVWQPGNYHENTIQYDLNGNIKKLKRNGDGGTLIDDLTYDFGTGLNASNKLLSVTDYVSDATDKAKGFSDGYTSGYDANGNMTIDRNKGIITPITYNHLNLPVRIVKNNTYLNYMYDASGRKWGQVAGFGKSSKWTEYIDAWVFENNELQFLQHEEGRIVLTKETLLFKSTCDDQSGVSPSANVQLANQTINGETYLKVSSTTGISMAKRGVASIGQVYGVTEGQRYIFKIKGYSNSAREAFLYVQSENGDLLWTGANLPQGSVDEEWVECAFTIPANVTQVTLGILWSTGAQASASDVFYVNDIEFYRHEATPSEYQYNLKDHLGNVRVTFTTKDEQEQNTATLEAANANDERVEFLRYDNARRVNHYLFDHTNGSSPTTTNGAAQRLSGQGNEIYGLAKSLSVMPGDVIDMEVYAKYVDSNSTNRTTALTTLISQIASGTATAGTVIDGSSYGTSTSTFPFPGGLNGTGNSAGDGPKAYLNWLVFDRDYNLILGKSGYQRMTTIARETGQDVDHEKLTGTVTISEPGYVYIYLSNEETTPVEVYFDDLEVTQIKSPVIASNDYYPFGLRTSNSYSRENSTENKYLYNGKELVSDLGLDLYDYGARQYDPTTGRWRVQDLKAELYFATTPYAYALNQPTNAIDPDGNLVIFVNGNHFGFSAPGASYWQSTQSVQSYKSYSFFGQHLWSGMERHDVSISFDGEVMDQLGDHNARYYDGSDGGWHPGGDDTRLSTSAVGRSLLGYVDGARDAKDIVANLARDKSGNIVETIKIITHSMGGAYGKGFVTALKDYIETLPKEQQKQILISLVADFDPFQAGDLMADPDIKTMQFIHKNGWNVLGMGGLANEEEQGDKDTHTNTGTSTDHSIFTFLNDISKLEEGTYKWDGNKFVKQ